MKYPPEKICFNDVLNTIEAYGGQIDAPRTSKHEVYKGSLPNGETFIIVHSYSHQKDVGPYIRAQWVRTTKIPKNEFWETYHTKVKTGAWKKAAAAEEFLPETE